MPVPLPKDPPSPSPVPTPTITSKPYPANTKTASASLSTDPPILTTVTQVSFTDRLLLTIVQANRGLAQWYQVPLDISGPTADDPYFATSSTSAAGGMSTDREDGLLPGSHFTPRSLLGGGAAAGTEREVLGQLFASQIASAIKVKEAGEKRPLVLGLGLDLGSTGEGEKLREVFGEIMGLVLQVL